MLFRLARGSGLTGLAGMAHAVPIPVGEDAAIFLVRPLLPVSKARLIATLKNAGVEHSEDPTQPRSAFRAHAIARTDAASRARRARCARPGALAARMRRAEATVEFAVAAARAALAPGPWREGGPIVFETVQFNDLPAEVALRLLGRAIAHAGNEGPVELGKLEWLYEALRTSRVPLRRTLAGALVTLGRGRLVVERAPPRRRRNGGRAGNGRFTK